MILEGKGGIQDGPSLLPIIPAERVWFFLSTSPKVETFQTRRQGSGESLPGVLVFWVLTSPAGSAAPWCLYTLVSMWMCHLGRGTDHMVCHHLTVEHRFLLFSTIGILSQVMWWGLSCACQDIQQRLTGLYRLDAHSIPILITKNCFWTLPNVPLEDRITPRWE